MKLPSNSRAAILVAALFFSLPDLRAQVPTLVNYQGRVTVGSVNFEGDGLFKFALVNSDGTLTFWSNDGTSTIGDEPAAAVALTVEKGLYSALLGDPALANMTAIPGSVFANPDVRLRIWFDDGANGSQLLAPDQRVAPSAYLADGAVTTAALADAAISGTKIAPAAIDGTHVAAGSLDFSHLFVPDGPGAGQVLGFNGTGLAWTAPGSGDGIWTLNGTNAYRAAGSVGIGTADPTATLDVRGYLTLEAGGNPVLLTGTGSTELNRYLLLMNSVSAPSASGLKAGGVLIADSYSYANPGKNDLIVKGRVGIGDTAPSAPLEIAGEWDASGIPNVSLRGRKPTIQWEAPSSFPEPLGTIDSWIGHVGPSNGLEFYYRFQDQSTFPFTDTGWQSRATLHNDGALHVVGDVTCTKLFLRPDPVATTNVTVQCTTAGVENFVPYNTANNRPMSIVVRNATVRQLTITGGADLAEPFPMKESGLESGEVVVIDDEHPGRLRRSTCAYDTRVAGVISGAGGIHPGIALRQEGVAEDGQDVALTGRVYVQADARFGAIRPGDLLTTSDTPGHAMKATDRGRTPGAVLGKAMTALDEGTGTVLVLVTLQ